MGRIAHAVIPHTLIDGQMMLTAIGAPKEAGQGYE